MTAGLEHLGVGGCFLGQDNSDRHSDSLFGRVICAAHQTTCDEKCSTAEGTQDSQLGRGKPAGQLCRMIDL